MDEAQSTPHDPKRTLQFDFAHLRRDSQLPSHAQLLTNLT